MRNSVAQFDPDRRMIAGLMEKVLKKAIAAATTDLFASITPKNCAHCEGELSADEAQKLFRLNATYLEKIRPMMKDADYALEAVAVKNQPRFKSLFSAMTRTVRAIGQGGGEFGFFEQIRRRVEAGR